MLKIYITILCSILFPMILGCAIILGNRFFSLKWNHKLIKNNNINKFAAFECGFPSIEEQSTIVNIRFYLIAMLFIIFDLEMAFLIPWVLIYRNLFFISCVSMIIFIFLLTIGLLYEWKQGALEWD